MASTGLAHRRFRCAVPKSPVRSSAMRNYERWGRTRTYRTRAAGFVSSGECAPDRVGKKNEINPLRDDLVAPVNLPPKLHRRTGLGQLVVQKSYLKREHSFDSSPLFSASGLETTVLAECGACAGKPMRKQLLRLGIAVHPRPQISLDRKAKNLRILCNAK